MSIVNRLRVLDSFNLILLRSSTLSHTQPRCVAMPTKIIASASDSPAPEIGEQIRADVRVSPLMLCAFARFSSARACVCVCATFISDFGSLSGSNGVGLLFAHFSKNCSRCQLIYSFFFSLWHASHAYGEQHMRA